MKIKVKLDLDTKINLGINSSNLSRNHTKSRIPSQYKETHNYSWWDTITHTIPNILARSNMLGYTKLNEAKTHEEIQDLLIYKQGINQPNSPNSGSHACKTRRVWTRLKRIRIKGYSTRHIHELRDMITLFLACMRDHEIQQTRGFIL